MIHFEADGSDLTGAVTQTYREGKIMGRGEKRGGEGRGERETDLGVEGVPWLPSSAGVQPSFGVAQGREEAGPCSHNQLGTFLEPTERAKKKKERKKERENDGD